METEPLGYCQSIDSIQEARFPGNLLAGKIRPLSGMKGDDGQDGDDDDATCGDTRPMPSTADSQTGDCSAGGTRSNGLRSTEALPYPYASHDSLSAAQAR